MATIEEIKEKVVPVLKEAGITKSALFGSYVRGEQKEDSDIDILVSFPENATLLDLVRLKRKLTEQLQKNVDIVSYNAVSPLIRDSIFQHQYPLL